VASTLVLTDPLFLKHNPGAHHPESPQRLESILGVLSRAPIHGLVHETPRSATSEELAYAHTPALLKQLAALEGQVAQIDPDTVTSEDSHAAAVRSAGAAMQAVERVMAGAARNAFALVRPPGHHAEPSRAMGFCLYNNAAIAAEWARRHGAQRVLVLDWDVHHGNGTQACFSSRRDVLYQSVHQDPQYPGTGAATEIGTGEGTGFTVNCGLPGGQGDADYGAVFEELLLPIAREYAPDLVIVSAGFDPHEDDPLADMRVTERGFAAMCASLRRLTEDVAGGKLVLVLEGGYSLEGLSQSVHACLEVLTGRNDDFPSGAGRATVQALHATREALKGRWKCLSRT